MPADENGQKQHGYSNIFNINFYSNCEEDDDGTIDATESRLARLRETVLAKSSGRRKAWIRIPQSVHSLPAYKNCEIVQVPGLTFLPLPSSFLYPKNSSLATLVRHQGCNSIDIWNLRPGVKDTFRKVPGRKMVKARVKAQVKANKNVY